MLLILFLWFFLSPIPLKESDHKGEQFIIWNVGQGQWTTYDTLEICYHFDVGGEHFPLKKIRQLCRHKQNEIYKNTYVTKEEFLAYKDILLDVRSDIKRIIITK
jgi:hypothetical protein